MVEVSQASHMIAVRVVFAICGLYLCGLLSRIVIPEINQDSDAAQSLDIYETQAAASLAGEVRSSLAAFLWAKTDEYIHGGVLLRPMTPSEIANGVARATSGDKTVVHSGYETGVVPEKAHDPRGFWGDIEREVKPYFDVRAHKHRDPVESLPLYRFMTWADPHFIAGYVVGAQVIASQKGQGSSADAISFLHEGIQYNPRSIPLLVESARYRLTRTRQYREAERELLAAIANASERRPAEPDLSPLEDAYRWLVLLYRHEGRREDELRWAREGLAKFPDDPVCRHTLQVP
jgi:tetratricopeptide (TPR) repeat protein